MAEKEAGRVGIQRIAPGVSSERKDSSMSFRKHLVGMLGTMVPKWVFLGVTAICLGVATTAHAAILTNQYTIRVAATQRGTHSWEFVYDVTNENQGNGLTQGLDGFSVEVPRSATISGVISPAPYRGSPGYWGGGISDDWGVHRISWWGYGGESVYPVGTTARFGFRADGVDLGSTPASVVTYYAAGSYNVYEVSLLGPVAVPLAATVPEPSTVLVWTALGAIGLGLVRRRRNRDCSQYLRRRSPGAEIEHP
jgi:hypothetical protein